MQINFSGQNFSKKIFMDVFLKRFMSGFSTFCKKGAFFTMDIPFGYIENVFSYLFKMPMSKCFLPINFFPVTFSHIYSFWWSMLILPCQCNLGNLFCCLLPSIQVLLLSFQVLQTHCDKSKVDTLLYLRMIFCIFFYLACLRIACKTLLISSRFLLALMWDPILFFKNLRHRLSLEIRNNSMARFS